MRKLIVNGNIITMDPNKTRVEAMCIDDHTFTAVGSNEEILRLMEEGAECINLQGKTVLPGLFETHMHVLSLGMLLKDINHNSCNSVQNLIEHSRKHIVTNRIPEGKWIRGRGWNQDNFSDESRFITRYDLDKVSKTHPLAFTRTCGHVIVVNSKALEIMGMADNAPEIEGGQIDLDENGVPLGIFRERARACVLNAIPEMSLEEVKELICLSMDEAVAYGITEIHTDDFKDIPTNYQKVIDAYEELVAEGKMKLRVYEQCNLPSVEKIQHFLDAGYYTGYGTEKFKLGPLKLLSDGSLGARTAYLNEPYSDMQATKGIPLFTQQELDDMIGKCHKAGMQVAIHAIGDGAIDMVLNSIEKAKKELPRENERHGIIHCQITTPQQIDKMKAMDLIAYIQPIFLNYDIDIAQDRIGERALTAYNWKEFLDKGVMVSGSSDCPVESLNIMENIYAAVVRKNLKGLPEGGWRAEQNLTVEEALKIFTINSAYTSFSEDKKGSITPGKLADFVVIDNDIFAVAHEKIKDIKVIQTYLGGDLVYSL